MLILLNLLELVFRTVFYKVLLIDRDFFEKSFEILKGEYFSSEAHQNSLVGDHRKLFNKYGAAPTYDTLKDRNIAIP